MTTASTSKGHDLISLYVCDLTRSGMVKYLDIEQKHDISDYMSHNALHTCTGEQGGGGVPLMRCLPRLHRHTTA